MGGWGQSLKRHLKSEGSPPSTTRVTLVLVGRFFFLMKPCKRKSGPAKWKISDQIKFYCFCQLHHHSYSPGHFSLPQIFPFWMIFSQSMPKYQRCHCQWCKIPKKNSKHTGICFTSWIKQTLSLCCISLKYTGRALWILITGKYLDWDLLMNPDQPSTKVLPWPLRPSGCPHLQNNWKVKDQRLINKIHNLKNITSSTLREQRDRLTRRVWAHCCSSSQRPHQLHPPLWI